VIKLKIKSVKCTPNYENLKRFFEQAITSDYAPTRKLEIKNLLDGYAQCVLATGKV